MRQSSEQKGNKPEAACDPANAAACISDVETSRAVRFGRCQVDGPVVILAAITRPPRPPPSPAPRWDSKVQSVSGNARDHRALCISQSPKCLSRCPCPVDLIS